VCVVVGAGSGLRGSGLSGEERSAALLPAVDAFAHDEAGLGIGSHMYRCGEGAAATLVQAHPNPLWLNTPARGIRYATSAAAHVIRSSVIGRFCHTLGGWVGGWMDGWAVG